MKKLVVGIVVSFVVVSAQAAPLCYCTIEHIEQRSESKFSWVLNRVQAQRDVGVNNPAYPPLPAAAIGLNSTEDQAKAQCGAVMQYWIDNGGCSHRSLIPSANGCQPMAVNNRSLK